MAQSSTADKGNKKDSSSLFSDIGEMKFETALAELENIVQIMEEGRLPLEESIAAYRRGNELLKHCQHQLNEAERKIQILEDGVLRDFDPTQGERGGK